MPADPRAFYDAELRGQVESQQEWSEARGVLLLKAGIWGEMEGGLQKGNKFSRGLLISQGYTFDCECCLNHLKPLNEGL